MRSKVPVCFTCGTERWCWKASRRTGSVLGSIGALMRMRRGGSGGREDLDAKGQVSGAGVLEGGAEIVADETGRQRCVEDFAGAAVEALQVQVEAVHPAGADLERGEVPIAGCSEQLGIDGR